MNQSHRQEQRINPEDLWNHYIKTIKKKENINNNYREYQNVY